MVDTLPDYSSRGRNDSIAGVVDMSELAARLKSIDTFDRRGEIVWMDDFESATPKWKHSLPGGRGSIATSAERCWAGSSSYKLVTGAVLNDYAWMQKVFSVPSSSRLGLELRVKMMGTAQTLQVSLIGDDGTNQYSAELLYNVATDTVSYHNSGGGYTALKTDVLFAAGEEIWVPMKMTIDWSTKKYVRAVVEDLETDLSAQPILTGATAGIKFISIWILFSTTEAAAKTAYIDNVIFTQNEP